MPGNVDLNGDGTEDSLADIPYLAVDSYSWAAGAIATTPADLVAFLRALFDGTLLDDAGVAELTDRAHDGQYRSASSTSIRNLGTQRRRTRLPGRLHPRCSARRHRGALHQLPHLRRRQPGPLGTRQRPARPGRPLIKPVRTWTDPDHASGRRRADPTRAGPRLLRRCASPRRPRRRFRGLPPPRSSAWTDAGQRKQSVAGRLQPPGPRLVLSSCTNRGRTRRHGLRLAPAWVATSCHSRASSSGTRGSVKVTSGQRELALSSTFALSPRCGQPLRSVSQAGPTVVPELRRGMGVDAVPRCWFRGGAGRHRSGRAARCGSRGDRGWRCASRGAVCEARSRWHRRHRARFRRSCRAAARGGPSRRR